MARRPVVLFIGTRGFFLERAAAFDAAARESFEVALVARDLSAYKKWRLRAALECDPAPEDTVIQAIEDFLEGNAVDPVAIVAWTDTELELSARLAQRLRLPGPRLEGVLNSRNKARTRQLLDDVEDVNPPYRIVQRAGDIIDAIRAVGAPCVIKPAGLSGGRGLVTVDKGDDVEAAVRRFLWLSDPGRGGIFRHFGDLCLVERRIAGTEHSVAGFRVGGRTTVLALVDKEVQEAPHFEYQNVTPSRLRMREQARVVSTAQRAVERLGLDNCGFHVDLKVDREDVKVLEVGSRLGGQGINSTLIPLAYANVQRPYRCLLRILAGLSTLLPDEPWRSPVARAGMRALLPEKPGRLREVEGMVQLTKRPYVSESVQVLYPGDVAYHPDVAYNHLAVGYVVASCGMAEDIDGILESLCQEVSIETE